MTNEMCVNFVKTPYNEEAPNQSTEFERPIPYGYMLGAAGGTIGQGIQEFWQCIRDHNVKTVISLIEVEWFHPTSLSNIYVLQYFPLEGTSHLEVPNTPIAIHCDHTQTQRRQHLTVRFLEVRDNESGQVLHTLRHVHFFSWPDLGVPLATTVPSLMDFVEECADQLIDVAHSPQVEQESEKMLVHCLKGQGRTGTMLALINAVITIKHQVRDLRAKGFQVSIANKQAMEEEIKISMFSIVRRLRQQRRMLVHQYAEYCFLHQALSVWWNAYELN